MATGALPRFIIIGAMKCGTTSLHHYLSTHPQISMSRQKELDYFVAERNYSRGEAWYRQWFVNNGTVCGECSPNYAKAHLFGGVPERIHGLLPDARLIYVLRDPVARFVSHWAHNIASGRHIADVDAVLQEDGMRHNFIRTGEYDVQLDAYLPYFPLERILIITAEKLRDQRLETLAGVFRFLDVDHHHDHPDFAATHHTLEGRLPGQRPVLSAEWNERILDHYRPHVQRLRQMTGLLFENWTL